MEIGRLGFELFEPMDLLKTGKYRWIFEYFGHQIDIKFREDYENPVVFNVSWVVTKLEVRVCVKKLELEVVVRAIYALYYLLFMLYLRFSYLRLVKLCTINYVFLIKSNNHSVSKFTCITTT